MNEIGAAVDAAAAKVGGPPAVMNGGVPALLQRERSLFTRCSLVSACSGLCSVGVRLCKRERVVSDCFGWFIGMGVSFFGTDWDCWFCCL